MKRNVRARASLILVLVAAGLLLTMLRPTALGGELYQGTVTPGLPTRPGLTRSPTAAATATLSPTVVPPLTATPLLPTSRPTEEPSPTAVPSSPPPTPEPTAPAVLPAAGVVRPAGYWIALLGGLALLAGAFLLRRRR